MVQTYFRSAKDFALSARMMAARPPSLDDLSRRNVIDGAPESPKVVDTGGQLPTMFFLALLAVNTVVSEQAHL